MVDGGILMSTNGTLTVDGNTWMVGDNNLTSISATRTVDGSTLMEGSSTLMSNDQHRLDCANTCMTQHRSHQHDLEVTSHHGQH
jgi:hypothetical protein